MRSSSTDVASYIQELREFCERNRHAVSRTILGIAIGTLVDHAPLIGALTGGWGWLVLGGIGLIHGLGKDAEPNRMSQLMQKRQQTLERLLHENDIAGLRELLRCEAQLGFAPV